MKNKKVLIGLGIVILAAILCIGGVSLSNKSSLDNDAETINNDVDANIKDIDGNDIISIDENGNVSYSYTDEEILNVQEYMNTYNHIAIELTCNEYMFDAENNLEQSTMTGRYLSEMYLDEKTADTRDFTEYESGQLWDEMPVIDFEKTFGFDYTQYNKAFDIGIAFVTAQGLSIDLENATMSDELYEEYGDRWYRIDNASSIVEKIMSGTEYDAINAATCSYVLSEDNTGNIFLDYFTATVNYTKDDKILSKCITCSFTLFIDDEEMSDGCTCGSEADCSSDDGCETDCNM